MWREMLEGWLAVGRALARLLEAASLVAFVALVTYSIWMGQR
jgi:hypothetical protein